jgi:hypothetical protein
VSEIQGDAHQAGFRPQLTTRTVDDVTLTSVKKYTNLFDFWYAEHWEDFRTCGPSATCPQCKLTPACHTSSEGGLLTDIDAMVQLTKPAYSGHGSWADADMLQVCNYGKGGANAGGRNDTGMTLDEYRASYSIWATFASPIIISADLRTIAADHPECLAMLLNKELIAIAQDPLGEAGALVLQSTNVSSSSSSSSSSAASSSAAPSAPSARTTNIVEQVFVRRLSPANHAWAVTLFNRREVPTKMTMDWNKLPGASGSHAYAVRDIWAHNSYGANRGVHADGYTVTVAPHAVVMLKVTSSYQPAIM